MSAKRRVNPWRLGPRRFLWTSLLVLVLALLATLIWLAGRYETSQVQEDVERDVTDAVTDVRTQLTRNLQDIQALQAAAPSHADWVSLAQDVLRAHREMVNIEWRDAQLTTLARVESPFRPSVFGRVTRAALASDVALNCAAAKRVTGPSYSASYFLPQDAGGGQEVLDLCLPLLSGARVSGYVVATYSLLTVLTDTVSPQLQRGHEISFTEPDGTRLAVSSAARRGARTFTAQQLLSLPGTTLMLRLVSWRAGPDLFPNVLTAVVTLLAVGLLSVMGLLGRDTRRRLQAERDLAEALAFRKAMEDSLVTGLLARDLYGAIRYVNPAFCNMVGFSNAEIVMSTPTPPQAVSLTRPPLLAQQPFWPPDLAARYQAERARHPPGREGLETSFVRKSGERFPVLIFDTPLIDARGIQTGWMSAFVDVSEQRRVEELSRASRERLQATARLATAGEMASLLSHELNQPLAAISSYATGGLNLLNDPLRVQAAGGASSIDLNSDLQGALRRIAEQAERAGKVIKSVHNFVRRREGERENVAPAALLDAVMPLVGLQAHKLGVHVIITLHSDLPPVHCDRTMVEQVLLNLARNGMQAIDENKINKINKNNSNKMNQDMPKRLQLTVTHDKARAAVRFEVADDGPGITPAVAAKLFTPFFTTKAEGMGLGLSLCRTVIEQHGGKLEFENAQPQGTIFSFTLPAFYATAPCNPPLTA